MWARARGRWGRAVLLSTALAVVFSLFFRPAIAMAHPLGNFTVNRYARLELSPKQIKVRYVLDMAEIPTFQEMDRIDFNRDGQVSHEEQARYTAFKLEELRQGLHLTLDDKRVRLTLVEGSPAFRLSPGQAGLSVLRLSAWYAASAPKPAEQLSAAFLDENYTNRLGWKEIVVRSTDGVSLVDSSVSSEDKSDELLSYPQDLLKSPSDIRQAKFTFAVTPAVGAAPKASQEPSKQPAGSPAASNKTGTLAKQERLLASLVTKERLTYSFVLLTVLVAVVWGAMHAFTPGHGKTIVAAYLIGSRARAKHALVLGAAVTVTHTLMVFALGVVTLSASRFILPEDLFPWLQLASGALVAAMGVWLLRARLRRLNLLPFRPPPSRILTAAAGSAHEAGHEHSAEEQHGHEHGHGHTHAGHTHAPTPSEEGQFPLKGLVALGVSGGLLPCPAAILIMLSAVSLNKVGLGLLLVTAFSIGLAGTLTGVGLLALYGQRLALRLGWLNRAASSGKRAAVARLLSAGSAFAVMLVGMVMTGQALWRL